MILNVKIVFEYFIIINILLVIPSGNITGANLLG